jgi:dipeptidyl-peptidase-4
MYPLRYHFKLDASVTLLLPPTLRETEITKYPMLVNVYGGPGSQQVSQAFKVGWGDYLASKKNVIYASIDGRGSGYSGDKMLFSVYRRLGTVEIEDQQSVTRIISNEFDYIDKEKIGIWGWSYGGYATAMSLATDSKTDPVFECGISVAPVTSWLFYGQYTFFQILSISLDETFS